MVDAGSPVRVGRTGDRAACARVDRPPLPAPALHLRTRRPGVPSRAQRCGPARTGGPRVLRTLDRARALGRARPSCAHLRGAHRGGARRVCRRPALGVAATEESSPHLLMRVLLVTPSPPQPSARTAVPVVAWSQLTSMRARHEVTIVTTAGPDPLELEAVERLRADGIEVHAVLRRDATAPSR